jgi:ATP-dependent DNA helicase RecG
LRTVQYHGNSRIDTIREQTINRGYASGYAQSIDYIVNLLPSNEIIGRAFRNATPMFPELAIREIIANAVIHQDFSQTGNGPMVEIFDQRLEVTSPGHPLVSPARFIDAPPKSRNESVASMMRRINICEERGSSWDKIVSETEFHQLSAPLIELPEQSTRIVLFGPKSLTQMNKDERMRAMYLHACLRYVLREHLTNSSVRERFGIEQRNSAAASRLISEAIEAGLIAPLDPQAGRKYMRYVPHWAADRPAL